MTIYDVADLVDPETGMTAPAVIMEFVGGDRLEALTRRSISRADARRIGLALLDAVGAYQRAGLAHRDLHDKNIIVGEVFVKVIDATCTESGYVGSTATKADLFRRDVERVRDHMLAMLMAGAASMDAVFKFQRDALINPTLEGLRAQFEEALVEDVGATLANRRT